jgi:antitoxin FitA
MAQVIIRNLDDDVVQRLKARAGRKGRSLEAELREVLTTAAKPDLGEFRELAAAIRARHQGIPQTDSVELLREDRDR